MRQANRRRFLLTPLREGRLYLPAGILGAPENFYSRPCGRGDQKLFTGAFSMSDFYSRPCGRGDTRTSSGKYRKFQFLLTPLREGRPRS